MRVRALIPCLSVALALAACSLLPDALTGTRSATDDTPPDAVEVAAPVATDPPPPDDSALRPSDPVGAGPRRTVASLGDPSRAGLWLETPLVRSTRPGQVTVVATGARADVTLVPIEGPETGASRLSLAAMRALGVSPADLVPLDVVSGG